MALLCWLALTVILGSGWSDHAVFATNSELPIFAPRNAFPSSGPEQVVTTTTTRTSAVVSLGLSTLDEYAKLACHSLTDPSDLELLRPATEGLFYFSDASSASEAHRLGPFGPIAFRLTGKFAGPVVAVAHSSRIGDVIWDARNNNQISFSVLDPEAWKVAVESWHDGVVFAAARAADTLEDAVSLLDSGLDGEFDDFPAFSSVSLLQFFKSTAVEFCEMDGRSGTVVVWGSEMSFEEIVSDYKVDILSYCDSIDEPEGRGADQDMSESDDEKGLYHSHSNHHAKRKRQLPKPIPVPFPSGSVPLSLPAPTPNPAPPLPSLPTAVPEIDLGDLLAPKVNYTIPINLRPNPGLLVDTALGPALPLINCTTGCLSAGPVPITDPDAPGINPRRKLWPSLTNQQQVGRFGNTTAPGIVLVCADCELKGNLKIQGSVKIDATQGPSALIDLSGTLISAPKLALDALGIGNANDSLSEANEVWSIAYSIPFLLTLTVRLLLGIESSAHVSSLGQALLNSTFGLKAFSASMDLFDPGVPTINNVQPVMVAGVDVTEDLQSVVSVALAARLGVQIHLPLGKVKRGMELSVKNGIYLITGSGADLDVDERQLDVFQAEALCAGAQAVVKADSRIFLDSYPNGLSGPNRDAIAKLKIGEWKLADLRTGCTTRNPNTGNNSGNSGNSTIGLSSAIVPSSAPKLPTSLSSYLTISPPVPRVSQKRLTQQSPRLTFTKSMAKHHRHKGGC